MFIYK